MILGVLSDTHGNRALMHDAAQRLLREHRADRLYHLGDDYADAEELAFAGHDVRYIPGLWCPEYRDWRVPNTLIDEYNGVRISCAHAEQDLKRKEREAHIVMCGHTHVARIIREDGAIHLNPGHLKAPRDRGQLPSYAVIRIDERALHLAIHEIDGALRMAAEYTHPDTAND